MLNKHLAYYENATGKKPQTVIITGANSQLAKALQRTAFITDPVFRLIFLTREQLDITDTLSVAKVLNQYCPHWVINCAAYNAVDVAEREPDLAYSVNSLGPELLAKQCLRVNARLVHISSDYVFSGSDVNGSGKLKRTHPYRETDSPAPLSVYAKSKLIGENAVLEVLNERAIVLRTAWLYGQDGHNFVKTMLKLMQTQASLDVINDQIGSPTWVDALGYTVWQLMLKQGHGLFHYAGGGECSWYQFASEIQRQALQLGLLTKQIPILPIDGTNYAAKALLQGKSLALRPHYSALCCEKLQHFIAMSELQEKNLHNNQDLFMLIPWQDWRQQLKVMLHSI